MRGRPRRVTGMNLPESELTGFIPPELSRLEQLEVLNLRNNRLEGAIPSKLGNLARLQHLILRNNRLTGVIPAELGQLTNLVELDLGHNQLTGEIPGPLGKLTKLHTLWLSNNSLSGDVPAQLSDLANLRKLDIDDNELAGCVPYALREAEARLGVVPYCDAAISNSPQIEDNFNGPLSEDWLLLGSAHQADTLGIILTEPVNYQDGSLFYERPFRIEKFEAEFSFSIQGGTGAGGLAFVMSRTIPDSKAIQLTAGRQSVGIQLDGFGVEFDIFSNTELDPAGSSNHVGLTLYPELLSLPDNQDVPLLRNSGVFDVFVTFINGRIQVQLKNDKINMGWAKVLDHIIPNFQPFVGYFGFASFTGESNDAHVIHRVKITGAQTSPLGTVEYLDPAAISANQGAISSGSAFTCAIQSDGRAACWGLNDNGRATPPSGARFVAVEAGDSWACGLQSNGRPRCWGSNHRGQAIPPDGEKFVSISGGNDHSCGIRTDGAALCWGDNARGKATPPIGEMFISVSVGNNHSCGLRSGGAAVCWGDDSEGRTSPPSDERFVSLSSGDDHSCGLRSDGAALCWGLDNEGQASPPTGEKFTAISSGRLHTCALRRDGTAVCWGENTHGQSSPPAEERFVAISCGSSANSCGMRLDGTVLCWGRREYYDQLSPPSSLQSIGKSPEASIPTLAVPTSVPAVLQSLRNLVSPTPRPTPTRVASTPAISRTTPIPSPTLSGRNPQASTPPPSPSPTITPSPSPTSPTVAPEPSPERGFFINSLPSQGNSGEWDFMDPVALSIIGITLTLVGTLVQLFRGR